MKRRLIIGLGAVILLLLLGGVTVVWNLRSLTDNQKNIGSGLELHHDYLSALTNLLTAQAELYRHQAGYGSDTAVLVSSVDSIDYFLSHLIRETQDPLQKAGLKELSGLMDEYRQKVSLLLTYDDKALRVRHEKEASELGIAIRDKLMGLYAVSEADTNQLQYLGGRIIKLSALVIYLTLILSVSFALIVSVWLMGSLTEPVNRLIEGTEAIAEGDFSRHIEVTSEDELGVLTERFNHMVEAISGRDEQIQSNLEELESTNEELNASYNQLEALTHELENSKKELEAEHRRLAEAKDYLENVIEDSPDIIITTDMDGNIFEFNRGAEDMLGYRREMVIGTPAENLYYDASERRNILKIIEESGKVTNYEARLKTSEGKVLDVNLTLSQLRDGVGNVIGTVGISRDITEIRKKREEMLLLNRRLQDATKALESARTDLEIKVDERTRELKETNKRLTESNIRIKEADRLKSEFMANMSHELRTPLNAIIGFSELLLDGIDGEINDVQRVDLTHIHDSGQHLLSIINDILDLSKIEAGKMELLKEDVDLSAVINGIVSVIKPLVKSKDIQLSVSIDKNIPAVRADGKRLKQIILNLMSNAAKFTEKGEIRISAKTADNDSVLIAVRDTGIGIREEDTVKVFEKFRQVDMSSTRNKGGTGLGMAITKKLVEMHGGSIWIESKIGAGTTFFVKLPTGLNA